MNKLASNPRRSLVLSISVLIPWLAWSACAKTAVFQGDIKNLKVRMESAAHSMFLAGRKASEDVSYSFLPDSAVQSMTLKASPPLTQVLAQIDRRKALDRFTQGHLGAVVQEDFAISELDQLDLLLVVDNSSSMAPYQERLAKGLKSLLSNVSNTDWHIMVTTISAIRTWDPLNSGHKIVTYGCPLVNSADSKDKALVTRDDFIRDPVTVDAQFAWKVNAGEKGDPVEHGLMAAVSGLDGECGDTARSWTRPKAQKAVLMLSDEENCGSDPDQGCDGEPDAEPNFFIKRAPQGTKFFALLYDLDRYSECEDQGYINKPDDYRYLIAKTGGMEGNICQGNYNATLEQISKNMHPLQKKEFTLTYVPESETMTFLVDGQPWTSSYSISEGSVRFAAPLPVDSKVLTIRYNHDPQPLISRFQLSSSIDPATLTVTVNEDVVDSTLYKVEDNQIVFFDTPAAQSKITAEYRVADALPTLFPLASDALPETVAVTVAGQVVTNFQVVGDDRPSIAITPPPRDGAAVSITYETAESRTVRYPALPYATERVVAVKASDGLTHQSLAMDWKGGELIFKREDITDKRLIDILYILTPDTKELALTLAQKPQDGSLAIASTAGEDCAALAANDGTRLFFPCPPEQLGHLRISYDYFSQIDKSFRMDGSFAPDAVWKVTIDGVATSDFTLEGSVISFPNQTFDPFTRIEVEVFQPVRLNL